MSPHSKIANAVQEVQMFQVVQYHHGSFHSILSGMGRNRGTLDSTHSKRAAQRHAKALRAETWRERAGYTYRVEAVHSSCW